MIRDELPTEEVGSLEAALCEFDEALLGQIAPLPPTDDIAAPAGEGRTVLVGEVGLDRDDAPEADRLLSALSELARRFPRLDVHARDSLGLIVADSPSRSFALHAGVPMQHDDDSPTGDPWGNGASSSPFTRDSLGAGDDVDGAELVTERLHCVGDGAVTPGLVADVSARYRVGTGGRVVLLHGTLESHAPVLARHMYSQEVLVRAANGRLLGRSSRSVGLDFWRVAELRVGVPLRRADIDQAATVELWIDVAERRACVLGRYREGEGLQRCSPATPQFDTHLDVETVDWPMPGLALVGDLAHRGEGLLTKAVVRFAVRDETAGVLDEDELDLAPLIPGERRAVGLELAWGLDERVASGEVTLATVLRRRVLVWRGALARLAICR